MAKKKKHRFLKAIVCILILCVILGVIAIAKNQIGAEFKQLNEADQAILTEYNTLCASLEEEEIWEGYNLEDKTILAMIGSWGGGYPINPKEPVSSMFAKEIDLPKNWNITVYRVSAATPGLMKFRFDGNFNSIGKEYSIFGNEVYYVKYDEETAVNTDWTSDHFVTFLSHEAFHYYMQDNWSEGSRISADSLTDEDLALLEDEYHILNSMQSQLISGNPDKNTLEQAARDYVDIMDKRLAANNEYVQQELEIETDEETATYVGIQASRRVGYDFGVMYFTNQKNVPFDDIIAQYQAGNIDKSYLANRVRMKLERFYALLWMK